MTFANEPTLELRRADARAGLVDALGELDRRLPLSLPVLIGCELGSDVGIESTDPGNPERVVATAGAGTPADAARAVEAAQRGAREWGSRPAAERGEILDRAAAALRGRRHELAAVQVRECAKPWGEKRRVGPIAN